MNECELFFESFFCFVLQGREGEIRHLYRNSAFLYSKTILENGGIFVCKTRHLVLAGGGKVRFRARRCPAPTPRLTPDRSAHHCTQMHSPAIFFLVS